MRIMASATLPSLRNGEYDSMLKMIQLQHNKSQKKRVPTMNKVSILQFKRIINLTLNLRCNNNQLIMTTRMKKKVLMILRKPQQRLNNHLHNSNGDGDKNSKVITMMKGLMNLKKHLKIMVGELLIK